MRPAEVRLRLGAFLAGALGLILGGTGAILQSLGFAGWPVAVIGAIVASTGLVVFVLDHARETQQRREESQRAAATHDAELRRLVRFWLFVPGGALVRDRPRGP